ncbi:UNVERIFIED_CONTAM: hypothetical protein FKN15_046183 [Acipenser sinensis]
MFLLFQKSTLKLLPLRSEKEDSTKFFVLTVITIVCIIGILAGSGVVYCLRHRSHHKLKEKLTGLGSDAGSDATAAYQELCRQRMAVKMAERPEPHHTSRINSTSSQFSDGPIPSPTARSSTSSWSEEPVQSNMNISTGHMVLMVWENGCVVIVMLTPLTENGVKQCYHYWPDEGSNLYNIYEVNLVSEHIWCEDFLVRSFYLKNLQTNETRTVTQFHFLSWMNQSVPESTRSLLDFRSDGAGRSGTYILIDMVLNKMAKGRRRQAFLSLNACVVLLLRKHRSLDIH